jgi:hypothetical protein
MGVRAGVPDLAVERGDLGCIVHIDGECGREPSFTLCRDENMYCPPHKLLVDAFRQGTLDPVRTTVCEHCVKRAVAVSKKYVEDMHEFMRVVLLNAGFTATAVDLGKNPFFVGFNGLTTVIINTQDMVRRASPLLPDGGLGLSKSEAALFEEVSGERGHTKPWCSSCTPA